jgi:hypothetical protein
MTVTTGERKPMTETEGGYAAWLAKNSAPDLQELVRQYRTYPQIPQAAWEKFDRDREDWEVRRRRRHLDEA